MIKQVIKKTIDLGDGRTITIETGKLAKQADGAVEVRMGNTMLLATVCSAQEAGEGVDFMPLQVEYKERFSAFGRFPGGFERRRRYARRFGRSCRFGSFGRFGHSFQWPYLGSTSCPYRW